MGQPPSSESPPPSPNPPDDRLDSWKEIAAYLRRDVTTVQRWEKREGMPVHRHLHDKLGSVYAFRADLDAWAHTRHATLAGDSDPGPHPSSSGSRPGVHDSTVDGGNPVLESHPGPPLAHAHSLARGRRSAVWLVAVAAAVLASAATVWLLERNDTFRANPFADARFVSLTDFNGTEQSAALSADGRFVAFLSDRDGPVDILLTQIGTDEFFNLTRGAISDMVNPDIRTVGFSPDGAFVTFWTRRTAAAGGSSIDVWAVPILGGQPRPYLEGVAEFDWSSDGHRLVFHTPVDGDPTFVRDPGEVEDRQLLRDAPGLHSHFPMWSRDDTYIYFVHGAVRDQNQMDIWRIPAAGGTRERITHHDSHVSHPVFADARTLLYLAGDADGAGPWLYSVDVERRVPRRVSSGIERYTSLAAAADGRRFVATRATTNHTFWRVPATGGPIDMSAAIPVSLTTKSGFFPRLGPDYLTYVVSRDAGDSIWKLHGQAATELWSAPGAQVIGAPAIAPDGNRIAFSIRQQGQTLLYVMKADGTDARIVGRPLALQGAPAWTTDGRSVTSAAVDGDVPRLFSVPLDGGAPAALLGAHSQDPAWSPDGFVVFSGPDIGTKFQVSAATADGSAYAIPGLELTRGGRHLRFLPGRQALIVMRGEIRHKDLWLIDLKTGVESQLTHLPPDFEMRDFDISPDGREIVLEQVEEQADIVLIELPPR